MTNVYLYGELRNKFGEEFKFNIDSPKEAFLAINANRRGFLDEIKRLAVKGVFYRIVVDEEVVLDPKELLVTKSPNEIHIVPVVWGAGKNGAAIGMLVVGAILVAVTAGAAAPALAASMGLTTTVTTAAGAAVTTLTTMGSMVASLGMGLALQGVMTLLFPPPKPDFNQEVQAGGKSYLFGNKPANASQGQAVPVGYGRLKIGSSQVSSTVDHYRLTADVKKIMTPVDEIENDFLSIENANEASESALQEYFGMNQSAVLDYAYSIENVSIANSYIDILTQSANQVVSRPSEVIVTRNGQIISNPNLANYYDPEIQYQWEEVTASSDASKGQVKIENPYSLNSGIIARSYHPVDFVTLNNFNEADNTKADYFKSYDVGALVKFGPSQFKALKFLSYDPTYVFRSGELVNYPTGADTETFFQAKENDRTGFFGLTPTGSDGLVRTAYWRKVLPPPQEYTYKCNFLVTGHLPSTGALDANGAPIAESYWARFDAATTNNEMNAIFNYFPAATERNQFIVTNRDFYILNEPSIRGSTNSVDNYGMEFLGYFYVSIDGRIKSVYELGTAVGEYEIIKLGETGQWSGIGFTGQGGVALTPRIGATFNKNTTQGFRDGKVAQVGRFEFKLDSDDASDLYIDQTLVSTYYGDHGMFSGFEDPFNPSQTDINDLHSTVTPISLTAGYHRLYARLYEGRGGEGITIYYRSDTNRDSVFSNWQVLPKDKLFYSNEDLTYPIDKKFLDQGINNFIVPDNNLKLNQAYRIIAPGSTNWTQKGAASTSQAGTVFYYNGSAVSDATAKITKDFVNYAQKTGAESNRIVRFVAKRKKNDDGSTDLGDATYKARYVCNVTLSNGLKLATSPVRFNVRFLRTTNSNQVQGSVLPIETQTSQN
jgi:predicted phage tail protein